MNLEQVRDRSGIQGFTSIPVLMYLCMGEPPPKPEKQRKRGECCRPQSKRLRHLQQTSPATPLAELPAQPITPATKCIHGCVHGAML